MRTISAVLIIVSVLASCTTLNIFKGPDDFNKSYYASNILFFINKAIEREVAKEPPSGYLDKPYSREIWDKYWNDRIFHLYELGRSHTPSSYVGPSGDEFISYIIECRDKAGLPPIYIEDRNIARLPEALTSVSSIDVAKPCD